MRAAWRTLLKTHLTTSACRFDPPTVHRPRVSSAICLFLIGLSALPYAKIVPERRRPDQSANMVRAFARGVNMIKKFILVAAATAVATSFLPSSSFAKKSDKAKEKPCTVGQVCMNKPDKKGWGTVMRCTYDRKMIGDFSPCNVHSGMCPTAICKAKKK